MNVAITSHCPTLLQRIAAADKSAVSECLNVYGNFVWRNVKKLSLSPSETELVVEDIFKDIWRYAGRYDSTKCSENDFILILIRYRLRQKQIH